mgnify:CR=1 FL=1
MTNREGFEPHWRDYLCGILDDVEKEYDRVGLSELPGAVPEEVLQKVENLMREHRVKDEVEAKKEAIQWWNDYYGRRVGT